MNTGMTFGLDGPVITGWWANPKTGDKFNAVDTFFEDNQLIVKTAEGRLLKYSQIQDYIKTDNPGAFDKPKSAPSKSKSESMPTEILNELESTDSTENDLLIADDNIFSNKNELLALSSPKPQAQTTTNQKKSDDLFIIERALGSKNTPSIKTDVKWNDFPSKEISLLLDIMNVPIDDVIDYYTNNIDMTEILDEIKSDLKKYIRSKIESESTTEIKKQTKKK